MREQLAHVPSNPTADEDHISAVDSLISFLLDKSSDALFFVASMPIEAARYTSHSSVCCVPVVGA